MRPGFMAKLALFSPLVLLLSHYGTAVSHELEDSRATAELMPQFDFSPPPVSDMSQAMVDLNFAPQGTVKPSRQGSMAVSVFGSTSPKYLLHSVFAAVILVVLIQIYFGKKENAAIALQWVSSVKGIFDSQFAVVGFRGHLLQMLSWHSFQLYASGRQKAKQCNAVVECLPRQCMWTKFFYTWIMPSADIVHMEIPIEDLDASLIAIVRRTELKQLQSMDPYLGNCPLRKCEDLSTSLCVLADNAAIVERMLTPENLRHINAMEPFINFIVVCDRIPMKYIPDEQSGIQASLTLPEQRFMDDIIPATQFIVGSLIDMVANFKLPEKAKTEVRKCRSEIEKQVHMDNEVTRADKVAEKRKEKKEREGEKVERMTPEQQKKWEDKQYKKSLKKRGPKLKVVGN